MANYNLVIIGGGFYGCCLALYLQEYFKYIVIIEKENDLLTRASANNQARVHQGYHYPRSFITALRCSANFSQFISEFKECIFDNFTCLYAVAQNNSKVNAKQFFNVYKNLNIPIKEAPEGILKMFNPDLIEGVFIVEELVFNVEILRNLIKNKLTQKNITLLFNKEVEKVLKAENENCLQLLTTDGEVIIAENVLNCTYSGINNLLSKSGLPLLPFKQEVAEIALITVPQEIKNFGITVVDGPFFSLMPFPAQGLHSLSHVRFTPHVSWSDKVSPIDNYQRLEEIKLESNINFMLKDAQRYLPGLKGAKYHKSLFEIKTVLLENETNDGRPILFRKDYCLKNFSVIMGGKIDNIYDILKVVRN